MEQGEAGGASHLHDGHLTLGDPDQTVRRIDGIAQRAGHADAPNLAMQRRDQRIERPISSVGQWNLGDRVVRSFPPPPSGDGPCRFRCGERPPELVGRGQDSHKREGTIRAMSGYVVSLQACPGKRQAMQPLDQAHFDLEGMQGDGHRASGSIRQVLLEDAETLEALGLDPGRVKENVTLRGISVNELPPGTRLLLGDVTLELTKECAPCDRMEEIRAGLKAELVGRRGVYARVITPGIVRVGDPVSTELALEEAGR